MISWIKGIYRNIKRVIKWIPVIWNNFDFDWVYLIKVFRLKLKLMEEYYETDKNTNCVGAEKHAKSIKICRILCDRLINDGYMDCLGLGFKNWDMTEQHNKLGISSDWLLYGGIMQKQDLELLCKILQKHLFSWWD